MMKIKEGSRDTSLGCVGNLIYGTVLKYQNSFYIKVDKKGGSGITLTWTAGSCIIMNMKTGRLRQISGNTEVQVMEVDACATVGNYNDHRKVC